MKIFGMTNNQYDKNFSSLPPPLHCLCHCQLQSQHFGIKLEWHVSEVLPPSSSEDRMRVIVTFSVSSTAADTAAYTTHGAYTTV